MCTTRKNSGLFPAGGDASRVAPLPCSKEIFPVGFQGNGPLRPKVAGQYLLENMRLAGVTKAYIVLRKGKWDIPSYFAYGNSLDLFLAYIIVEKTAGVPFTLDRAYPYLQDDLVLFGFPDILFQPKEAFVHLMDKQKKSEADLVLGLFPANEPQKVDMVQLDNRGGIKRILIKPLNTDLAYTWIIAVWTPVFSRFMHDFVQRHAQQDAYPPSQAEVFLGEVINAALSSGIATDKVIFEHGKYLDIGTPEDMIKARQMTAIQS